MKIGDIVFQVEFNKVGVSKLLLMNDKEIYKLDSFSTIFDSVHWGINMSGKKYGRYDSVEKSLVGTCETTFDIGKTTPSKKEIKVEKGIVGYSFDVPAFEGRTGNEPIVIEKNRNVDRCPEQMLYVFGSIDHEELNNKYCITRKTEVTWSQNRLYLGRNSFSVYTRTMGILDLTSSPVVARRGLMHSDGYIRLSLESVRPTKEAIQQMDDSLNAGVETVWSMEGCG